MGRNTGIATDPKQAVERFTTESIVANDLLWLDEAGLVKKAAAATPLSVLNSNASGLTVSKALATVEPTTAVENRRAGIPASAQMGDGIVLLYNTSTGTGLNIVKRDLSGATVLGPVNITGGTVYSFMLVKLSDTRVAAIWATISSTLSFRLYDQDLNTVGSQVSVSTNSLGATMLNDMWAACVLSTGNLLVAWRTNTGSDCLARVWSAADASAVTADLDVFLTGTPSSIAVCALDSGGFAVSWFSTTYQFARFDSAGAMVGSVLSVAGSTNEISFGTVTERLIKFSNNYLVMQYGTSAAKPQFGIYDTSNTLVVTINPTVSTEQNELMAAMCTTQAGFAFAVHTSKTAVAILEYSSAGALLRSYTLTFSTEQDDLVGNEGAILFEVPGQGFIYLRQSTDGSVYALAWAMVGISGGVVGSIISTTEASAYGSFHAVLTSHNMLFVHLFHTTMQEAVYSVGKKSIAGVALNAASSGKVKVARKGVYTLTETYTKGFVFNTTAYDLKGTRGVVSSNKATLFGVVE